MNTRADVISFQLVVITIIFFSEQIISNISYHFVCLIREVANSGLSMFESNQWVKHLDSLIK